MIKVGDGYSIQNRVSTLTSGSIVSFGITSVIPTSHQEGHEGLGNRTWKFKSVV